MTSNGNYIGITTVSNINIQHSNWEGKFNRWDLEIRVKFFVA